MLVPQLYQFNIQADGKSYQAFSHKGVFFVIIDTDGDVDLDAEYFPEQQKWFRNIVESKAFE